MTFPDPPGRIVVWIRAAIARTGCSPRIALLRRPFKRVYAELEQDRADLAGLAAPTPEHLDNMIFPLSGGVPDARLSYYSGNASLWVRRGEQAIHWNGQTLSGPAGFRVGVPPGTSNEALARQHGWPVDVGKNGLKTLEQLALGRFPVALVNDATVYSLPDDEKNRLEKLQPSVQLIYFFSAASKPFYRRYPAFVELYWSELCKAARADKEVSPGEKLPACR